MKTVSPFCSIILGLFSRRISQLLPDVYKHPLSKQSPLHRADVCDAAQRRASPATTTPRMK